MCVIPTIIGGISTLLGIGGSAAATTGAAGVAAAGVSSALPAAGVFGTGLSTAQAITLGAAGLGAAATTASGIYQKNVADRNAQIAEQNARQQEGITQLEIVRQQRERAQIIGQREAQFGAAGVDQNSGSALLVLLSEIEQGQLDTEILRFEGNNRQENLRFQADSLRQQGRIGLGGSVLNAGGTILGGASQAGLFGG